MSLWGRSRGTRDGWDNGWGRSRTPEWFEITQSWSRKRVHYRIRHRAPHSPSVRQNDTRDGKLYIINLLEISGSTQENRSHREGEEGEGNTIKCWWVCKIIFLFWQRPLREVKVCCRFILVTFSPLSKCHKFSPPSPPPPLPSNIKTFGARMKGMKLIRSGWNNNCKMAGIWWNIGLISSDQGAEGGSRF